MSSALCISFPLTGWCVYTRVPMGLVDNRKGVGKAPGRKQRTISRLVPDPSPLPEHSPSFSLRYAKSPSHHRIVPGVLAVPDPNEQVPGKGKSGTGDRHRSAEERL